MNASATKHARPSFLESTGKVLAAVLAAVTLLSMTAGFAFWMGKSNPEHIVERLQLLESAQASHSALDGHAAMNERVKQMGVRYDEQMRRVEKVITGHTDKLAHLVELVTEIRVAQKNGASP